MCRFHGDQCDHHTNIQNTTQTSLNFPTTFFSLAWQQYSVRAILVRRVLFLNAF
jgi:hypothetical protein